VSKGAKGLTSAAVNIGPNSRYYGNSKDMHLLTSASTPTVMPAASLRRSLMARLKPELQKVKNIGLLGLAGAVLVSGVTEENRD
jgi:hypothetical protein